MANLFVRTDERTVVGKRIMIPISGRFRKLTRLSQVAGQNRPCRGSYLIEAVIACLVAAIITTSLTQSYAQLKATGTHSQAELEAIAIAQECIDQLRVQQYSYIAANLGTHTPTIVGTSPTGDAVFPRPLLRDTTNLTFYNNTESQVTDQLNYIRATNNQATVTLTQDPNNAQSIDVSVAVVWSDTGGSHTYTLQTIISSNGLNG